MEIIDQLKSNFLIINRIYWENEDQNHFLRIEVSEKDLSKLAKISLLISQYLDQNYLTDKQYFLDIFSLGTEKEIAIKLLKEYLNSNIKVTLNKIIKGRKIFEGKLINVFANYFEIKWNNIGRIQRQQIQNTEVITINLSAKINKSKKEK